MTMILVTGGTGLTGQFVVAALRRRGLAVRVLCRPESAARARAAGAEVALGDLLDPASVARAARGASGIIHTACTYGDSAVDIAAMEALLGAWGEGPFVFVSSLDVYGFAGPGPIDEEAPLSETFNDYSRGKVACERLLAAAADRAGRRDHVALRAPYIFGPHPTARRRLIGRRLEEGLPIVLPGADPAEWRQYRDAWIDVRELTTVILASLAKPAGGPLNVLAGHFVWHDLYARLIRLTGSRSEIVHRPLAAIDDAELPRKELYAQTWRFSAARLARHLGAIPHRTLAASLRDTAQVSG
jgi:nucleoside-diphosphate-sugar epimerase